MVNRMFISLLMSRAATNPDTSNMMDVALPTFGHMATIPDALLASCLLPTSPTPTLATCPPMAGVLALFPLGYALHCTTMAPLATPKTTPSPLACCLAAQPCWHLAAFPFSTQYHDYYSVCHTHEHLHTIGNLPTTQLWLRNYHTAMPSPPHLTSLTQDLPLAPSHISLSLATSYALYQTSSSLLSHKIGFNASLDFLYNIWVHLSIRLVQSLIFFFKEGEFDAVHLRIFISWSYIKYGSY